MLPLQLVATFETDKRAKMMNIGFYLGEIIIECMDLYIIVANNVVIC